MPINPPGYEFPVEPSSALALANVEADPYSVLYRRLWELLEAEQQFRDLIPEENRIKFAPYATRKRRGHTADLPEARIVPTGSVPRPRLDSHHYGDNVTWAVQIATGTAFLTPQFFALRWACLRAFADAYEALRGSVLFDRRPIIVRVEPQAVTDQFGIADEDRVKPGWLSAWAMTTELAFPVRR